MLSTRVKMESLFHEKARSSNGCGACSPERGRQCPGGQRQGSTAAAGRDEGVTLRHRLYREGAGFAPALLLMVWHVGGALSPT
jgi:hypothetical protein